MVFLGLLALLIKPVIFHCVLHDNLIIDHDLMINASMSYLQWNVTWPEPSTLNTSGVQSCPAAMMEVGDTHMQLWWVNTA